MLRTGAHAGRQRVEVRSATPRVAVVVAERSSMVAT
jgi:hypothetical protein